MQFNVLREIHESIGSVNQYDIAETHELLGDADLSDVSGKLTLLRTDRGLLVTVHASAYVNEACARCATPVHQEVHIDLEEEYVPVYDPNTGLTVRVSKEDEVFRIGPHFDLDLREGLRQYFLMSEPLQPLCRNDCAGLCPACGTDLNERLCGCASPSDPRWSVLAGSKTKTQKGS